MDADGKVRTQAESDAIGTGGRWLHQLASGAVGPFGETEIIEIQTPHIGGIVGFYRLDSMKNKLEKVAQTSFYTSHEIGSRNVDKALVADLNGDGVPELVVQNQQRTMVQGLQRVSSNSVEKVWSMTLDAPIHSNIALACVNGSPQLLFGTNDAQFIRIVFEGDEDNPDREESSAAPSFSSGFFSITPFSWVPTLSPIVYRQPNDIPGLELSRMPVWLHTMIALFLFFTKS